MISIKAYKTFCLWGMHKKIRYAQLSVSINQNAKIKWNMSGKKVIL